MTWLLFFLATTAFGAEQDNELNNRLLGEPTEQVAAYDAMADDGIITPKSQLMGMQATGTKVPKAASASSMDAFQTMYGMWPLFIGIFAAGGFLVLRKKGVTIPGLSKVTAAPAIPMKVISRNSLGGNAAILLVDVEGADGVVRRLLLGTGGNATPSLVTDLGARGGQAKATSDGPAIPESFSMKMKQELGPVPAPKPAPAPVQQQRKPVAFAEFEEQEYNPEGVEPGSDPLHTRLRRVHRHRPAGARAVIPKTANGGNWKVNSFAADAEEGTTTEVDEDGITVKMSNSKSHLEAFAAKNVTTESEVAAVPAPANDSRKRLDVSNAFEAELRRRVYDATPSERKARSEAAKALVNKMIQERMGQAQSA
jgi:hypothetical protein